MCRTLRILPFLLLATLAVSGCKTSSMSNPPLAPGYTTPADQSMGQSLTAAKGFYSQIQSDIAAGKYSPSPSEKTALDMFAVTLNQAQLQYLAFHNGALSQAQAQAAVNSVVTAQAQLSSQLPLPAK